MQHIQSTSIDLKLFINGTPYTITYNVSTEKKKCVCTYMYYYFNFQFCRTTYTTHESIAITRPIFLFNRLLKSRRRNRLMKKVSKLAL